MVGGRLRTKTKRKISSGEIYLLPSHVPRAEFNDEVDRIGNTWVKERRLYCSAFVPADAFYSLSPVLAEGKFVEMKVRVRNLRYGKGHTDDVELDFELTDLDEEEAASLPDEPVQVRTLY